MIEKKVAFNPRFWVCRRFDFLWYDHSNETFSAALSHGTIYSVYSTNFCVCGNRPLIESSSKGFSGTIYDDINPINIKLLKL